MHAYAALWNGAIGSPAAMARTLRLASPLIFTGLAVAVAFRAGMINLGIEGSLYLGALSAALTAIYLPPQVPGFVRLLLAMGVGASIGGAWAFFPGYLRARWGVDEIVTTLMLNYVAILLVEQIVHSFFLDPVAGANTERVITVPIPEEARLPFLSKEYGLTFGLIIGIGMVILLSITYARSVWGFEADMTGLNQRFARYGGVNTFRVSILSMVLSGMLGGLAGATEILGIYGRFLAGFSTGLGFDGITVALMGSLSPFGVLFGAFFFGALKNGGSAMELEVGVSRNLVVLIQGLILLLVSAQILGAILKFVWRTRVRTKA